MSEIVNKDKPFSLISNDGNRKNVKYLKLQATYEDGTEELMMLTDGLHIKETGYHIQNFEESDEFALLRTKLNFT